MDQVFDAQMKKMDNKKTINKLRTKIRKLKYKVFASTNFKSVRIDKSHTDSLEVQISDELFDIFTWGRVRTQSQAAWKEYFHTVYDTLIHDVHDNHTTNILMSKAVVEYHDTFAPPEPIDYRDPLYSLITSIDILFKKLKLEQIVIYNSISQNALRDSYNSLNALQCEITETKRTLDALEDDNRKYSRILKWSVQDFL
jgi:hypothetical protein